MDPGASGLRAINQLKTQCYKNFILIQWTLTITLNKAFMKYVGIQNFILWQSQEIIKRVGFFPPTFVWPLPTGHTSLFDHLGWSSVIGWGGFEGSPASLAKVDEPQALEALSSNYIVRGKSRTINVTCGIKQPKYCKSVVINVSKLHQWRKT